MDDVIMYLRKSRLDNAAESVQATLSRHKATLLQFAKRHNLNIVRIFEEVVSGDSIYDRPQMLELLDEVAEGKYNGVLCMDIDRLGRGDMQEQGLILGTFKDSNTLIITPDKSYNLNDETDEETTEMYAFIARRELKMIKKRLSRGKQKSIEEGCYMANAPYGYRKATVNRKPTLEIIEEEAKIVKTIFDMYVYQHVGAQIIAEHVNQLGAKPRRGDAFSRNTIRYILRNPVYIGKIVWNRKKHIRKSHSNIKHIIVYNPESEWTVIDGLHPAIIDEDTFNKAQAIRKEKGIVPYYKGETVNPIAGLIVCSVCGQKLQMQNKNDKPAPHLLCTKKGCSRGTRVDVVEKRLIDSLRNKVAEYEANSLNLTEQKENHTKADNLKSAIAKTKAEIAKLDKQQGNLHDLLEQGIYDVDTFLSRGRELSARKQEYTQRLQSLQHALDAIVPDSLDVIIPKIKGLLRIYWDCDAPERNRLLKEVVRKAIYTKTKAQYGDDFTLDVQLKL